MVLRETECLDEVLGTDIDTDVLNTSQAGVYRAERTASFTPERLRHSARRRQHEGLRACAWSCACWRASRS